MKRYFFAVIAPLLFLACNNSQMEGSSQLSDSTTKVIKAVSPVVYSSVVDSSKLMVIQRDGKTVSYYAYKKVFQEEASFTQPTFTYKDIDGDGNNEIVVDHYTGGAHCCDVTTILTRSAENEMTEVFDFTGGTTINKDTVQISFFEALGYFHTCYACGIDFPRDIAPTASFLYSNGKFSYVVKNMSINEEIDANLKAITLNGIPDKDSEEESGFDNGTRKAIAYNIVAFYYNNARDINLTKKLFEKYYTHKDKALIWKDLADAINSYDSDIRQGINLR
ncbi:MAG: hypothetical protein EOO13_11955 [Chitinophagaceae bacterium]|nr:MAG: hypothetical protein EOO13_11955 [Chitinophagaceae bacterium]